MKYLPDKLYITLFICIITLFSSIIFIVPSGFYAQNYKDSFDHISIEDGISQSSILCILQDSKGFMWFGTYDGLNRYDGYGFKIYKSDPNDTRSLCNNVIFSICQDKSGTIWIGTYNGLNKFDWEEEKFTRFMSSENDSTSLSNQNVRSILTDYTGTLWVGTGNGLNKYIKEKNQFKHYFFNPKNKQTANFNFIKTIYEDRSKKLWIGIKGVGLGLYNRKSDNFIIYKNNPSDKYSLADNNVNSITEDKNGNLWIATSGGLSKFDLATGKFFNYYADKKNNGGLISNEISNVLFDSKGKLWAGTERDGVAILDIDKNKFSRIFHNPRNFKSITDDNIFSIYEDKAGIIWIGTRKGIDKYIYEKQQFEVYEHDPDNINSLSNDGTRSITEDFNGNLWVGTWNGLNLINRKLNTVTHYNNIPGNSYSLAGREILSLCVDKEGTLWAGTKNGLNKFDKSNNRFIRFTIKAESPEYQFQNDVYSIIEDKNGLLWVGTDGGLYSFNKTNGVFTRYPFFDNQNNQNSYLVWCILEDNFNNIWVGTDGYGIFKLNKQNNKFTRFTSNPNMKFQLSDNRILSLFEDSNFNLWVGTSGGLNMFDRAKSTFTSYTEKDKLVNNTVYAITEDNEGCLWFSTNRGISRVNLQNKIFKYYDSNSGLLGNEFSIGAVYKNKSGEIFFGGTNGVNYFNPGDLKENMIPPPVVITNFKIYNSSVLAGEKIDGRIILRKSITATDKITLLHTDQVFSFEFAALHYFNPNKNRYKYILQGFENNWNDVGNRRTATYTNIPPGKYKFTVIAANSDGLWNQKGTSIDIIIAPPFWNTLSFKILAVILSIILIFIFFKLRVKRIEARNQILENEVLKRTSELEQSKIELEDLNYSLVESQHQLLEINHSKDKFFSILSHDLKNPFNSLNGFLELLAKEYNTLTDEERIEIINIVNNTSKHALELLENLLIWSMSQTGRIKYDPERINLLELLNEKLSLLIPMAKMKNIEVCHEIPKNINVFADNNMLMLILRNLITNAIKFTYSGGTIKIGAVKKGGSVEICVEDNGVGMDSDTLEHIFKIDSRYTSIGTNKEKGTGLGLILCKEFVEKNNGKIWVESQLKIGTKFIFVLPSC